ncbi:MAG: hypothetical protein ACLTS6_13070 [Anaerobutyricum sp.]
MSEKLYMWATGNAGRTANMIISRTITAVIIVLCHEAWLWPAAYLGSWIIFPALSAMRVMQSFKGV